MWNSVDLIKILQGGGIAVIPTDTIYGIVGRADLPDTVARIYKIKNRAPEKKCIILIGDWKETKNFGIDSSEFKIPETNEPTSFILENIAFRLPQQKEFQDFLLQTGPLIAPSANPESLPPAQNISEAKNYFGDAVDFYEDGGTLANKASKIIKLNEDNSTNILRD
jgi:L-threonylcarbamoyladenylate synthase